MPAYRIVYGDDDQVVRETFHGVELEREDGWTVLFRGTDAILRVQDAHIRSIERLDAEVTVGDLMRPAVTSVERTAHLAAATYLFKRADDSALVVVDDVRYRVPVAVITDADVAQAVADGRDPEDVRISELVSREPTTVSPDTGVAAAADLMLSARLSHLPVVEGERLVGIVDLGDVCRGLLAPEPAAATPPA